ncbi:MAG: HupE/UreJ family protein [Armatimonadota bacterium]|nr:HupE/UreJ family protein [Armatimonadota bacterium]
MRRAVWTIVATLGLLVAAPAWAHVGVGPISGFPSGVLHPLSGADHWVAMVAVGIWARFLGGHGILTVPLGFVASMALGSLVGVHGRAALWTETGILASLLFFGLALLLPLRLTTWLGSTLVTVFAFFHGHAHGAEIPPGRVGWAYIVGFVATTVLLHLLGILLGEGLLRGGDRLRRRHRLVRLAGLGVLVLGVGGVLA